jgi:hypothetical protein
MDDKRARELLNNLGVVRPDGSLGRGAGTVHWPARYHSILSSSLEEADLDGSFSADELEAIAWWMRNQKASLVLKSRQNPDHGDARLKREKGRDD